MAAKQKKRPRPNKNSDGGPKKPQPTMSHEITSSPAPPPEAPAPPGAPAPGRVNPMTHPNLQASPALQAQPASTTQVQERIQFKDLPPTGQAQTMEQLGINPNAPIDQGSQAVGAAMQAGPSSGPIPNQLTGPGIPPDAGLEGFPDDMAHLMQLMKQGYAPGASHQEHGLAMNANALARATLAQSQPSVAPPAPAAPALPEQMGAAPPVPGAVPPELLSQIMDLHKKKKR